MKKILIVAGGTGGHIIPAVAFGQWAITSGRAQSVTYVCGSRPLERNIYNHFGILPHILPVEGSPLGIRKIGPILGRSRDLVIAWLESKRFLSREEPSGAFLFGGYVSLPFLFACRKRKIPMSLHEQNARAGKVTRLACRLGVPVAAGWSECDPLPESAFKTVGTPTRKFDHLQPEGAWNKLNVGRDLPSGPKVLVLGGSLGSSRLTDAMLALAGAPPFQSWTFLILGAAEQPQWRCPNVCFLPKEWNLSPHFAVADLAVSRGGGSTLSELETLGIPALVVPWRQASGDHQQSNATLFMGNGLGITWDEGETHTVLAERLSALYRKNRDISRHQETENRISAESINAKLWQLVFESK